MTKRDKDADGLDDKTGEIVDKNLDGFDDETGEVTEVPIELGPIPNCSLCNDTGSVPKRMHTEDDGTVVIDEYKNCSCGKAQADREEAKKFKAQ